MLEQMDVFFERRLADYDTHMMTDIVGAAEFYPFTAECLPKMPDAAILDLGCGTGLELEPYFKVNPTARVTGIDLSAGMLRALREKLPNQTLTLRQGSYFDLDLGRNVFDAAVSVESLHHFAKEEKVGLYKKVKGSLKQDGYLILTDYFAASDEEEIFLRGKLVRLKQEQEIDDSMLYHYDTPLTVTHETEALLEAGFERVKLLKSWGATHTLWAG